MHTFHRTVGQLVLLIALFGTQCCKAAREEGEGEYYDPWANDDPPAPGMYDPAPPVKAQMNPKLGLIAENSTPGKELQLREQQKKKLPPPPPAAYGNYHGYLWFDFPIIGAGALAPRPCGQSYPQAANSVPYRFSNFLRLEDAHVPGMNEEVEGGNPGQEFNEEMERMIEELEKVFGLGLYPADAHEGPPMCWREKCQHFVNTINLAVDQACSGLSWSPDAVADLKRSQWENMRIKLFYNASTGTSKTALGNMNHQTGHFIPNRANLYVIADTTTGYSQYHAAVQFLKHGKAPTEVNFLNCNTEFRIEEVRDDLMNEGIIPLRRPRVKMAAP